MRNFCTRIGCSAAAHALQLESPQADPLPRGMIAAGHLDGSERGSSVKFEGSR
jgi:hypothetical protein